MVAMSRWVVLLYFVHVWLPSWNKLATTFIAPGQSEEAHIVQKTLRFSS